MESMKETVKAYLSVARIDHWVKHFFIIPGIMLAVALMGFPAKSIWNILFRVVIGFLSACFIASANYTINEWLDAATDAFHPEKRMRASSQGVLKVSGIYIQYTIFLIFGMTMAFQVNKMFFLSSIAFVISGIIYNVKPMRTKDIVYLDVLTESLNNPIRLFLGWSMITGSFFPPVSFVLSYYFGGAFLMASKRMSEYRHIMEVSGEDAASGYRASFKYYTFSSLVALCCFCMICSSTLLGIFMYKYHVEYILLLPLIALLFAYYMKNALKSDSLAQKPEKLFKDKKLILILVVLVIGLIITSICELPFLEKILFSEFGAFQIE